jgi:hypothetical protein
LVMKLSSMLLIDHIYRPLSGDVLGGESFFLSCEVLGFPCSMHGDALRRRDCTVGNPPVSRARTPMRGGEALKVLVRKGRR